MIHTFVPLLLFICAPLNNDVPQDSLPTDTLREVTIVPLRRIPIEQTIDESLRNKRQPHVPTVAELLEKVAPGLNDKVTHPFAIKERKQERRRKRVMQTLDDYDKVRTFDELLKEAYEKQMKEDEEAGK